MTKDLLLSQAIDVFLIARQGDSYSQETINQYRWALERLLRMGDKPLKKITTEDIRAYLYYLQTTYKPNRPNGNTAKLGSASIFAAWKAIRGFYKWACPEFGIPNPAVRIPAPKHASEVITPFSKEEIVLILKACERSKVSEPGKKVAFSMARPTAVRDKAIILTLLDMGIRVSELCRLQVKDCNLQTRELIVRPYGSSIKSRPRIIPIGRAALKALALQMVSLGDPGEPLFQSLKGSRGRMERSGVLQILTRIGERAGVEGVHPHRFRHTFAIEFLRNGGDIFSLQRLLGHSSLEMVKIYLEIAQSDVENAHRKASPADNWRL